MALIECKTCGKKISNTTDKCIHCGSPTKEHETKKDEAIVAPPSKTRDYDRISDYERLALEMEFIRQDENAMKYKIKQNDRLRLKKLKSSGWLLWLFSFLICTNSLNELGIATYTSKFALSLALIFNVSLLFFVISSAIYLLVTKKAEKTSKERFIYLKSYQRWLLSAKAIEYTPIFKTEKEKILFEETAIESLNLQGGQNGNN